jgi:threonyl-tRNA synthetase
MATRRFHAHAREQEAWEQSGHWEPHGDNMFKVEVRTTFSLKPMNCPRVDLRLQATLWSYRDLPLRYSEMGRHRNERSGR